MRTCYQCENPADSPEWSGLCVKHGNELTVDLAAVDAVYGKPPCAECGAMTQEEAETRCRCSGDKDDCHGCRLWPD